jgi:hypothetical protein
MKLFWQSKTVWMNFILTLIGAGTLVSDKLTSTPSLTVPGWIMVGVGILGMILRIWFTDAPIATTAVEIAKVKTIRDAAANKPA